MYVGLNNLGLNSNTSEFGPNQLFSAGEQGVWYDPSDLSTLFQDAGATTPVTTAGQTVALMRDKSGRGNHLSLSNCTLGQENGFFYLVFNGTTTGGVTAAIDFTGTDAMTAFAGVRKLSDAAAGSIAELGNNSGLTGQFLLMGPLGAATNFFYRSVGTSPSDCTATPQVAPISAVLTGQSDISSDTCSLRVNRAVTSSASDQGTGNYRNDLMYVGRRGGTTFPFNGRLYSLIIRGAATPANTVLSTEAYIASKMGLAL